MDKKVKILSISEIQQRLDKQVKSICILADNEVWAIWNSTHVLFCSGDINNLSGSVINFTKNTEIESRSFVYGKRMAINDLLANHFPDHILVTNEESLVRITNEVDIIDNPTGYNYRQNVHYINHVYNSENVAKGLAIIKNHIKEYETVLLLNTNKMAIRSGKSLVDLNIAKENDIVMSLDDGEEYELINNSYVKLWPIKGIYSEVNNACSSGILIPGTQHEYKRLEKMKTYIEKELSGSVERMRLYNTIQVLLNHYNNKR